MSLVYQALLTRSGLSENGAARLHGVSVEDVRRWRLARTKAPVGAFDQLLRYCRRTESQPATDPVWPSPAFDSAQQLSRNIADEGT